MISDREIEQYARQAIIELGSTFSEWEVVSARFMSSRYPQACYWISDKTNKVHPFCIDLPHDRPHHKLWLKDEIKNKLQEIQKVGISQ